MMRPAPRMGVFVVVALVAAGAPLQGQEVGFLTGVVVDDQDGQPLDGAKVRVPALGLETTTEENGGFLLENVPAGGIQARFEAEGYVSVVEDIQLSTADFLQVRLNRVDAVLDQILVIAGRRPAGPANGDVALSPEKEGWRSVLDLLDDQVPGVIVMRDSGAGTGAALRIRGVTSFLGDSQPDVYLDGVRISGESASPTLRMLSQGGRRGVHLLDQIPAEAVDRIRVLKGAAATTAYPLAANGVIIIETNRGGARVER